MYFFFVHFPYKLAFVCNSKVVFVFIFILGGWIGVWGCCICGESNKLLAVSLAEESS